MSNDHDSLPPLLSDERIDAVLSELNRISMEADPSAFGLPMGDGAFMNPMREVIRSALATKEAELAALRVDAGWRPIEEAPRDGSEVLGWKPTIGLVLVRWLDADHPDYQGDDWHTAWEHAYIEGLTMYLPVAPPAIDQSLEQDGSNHGA